MNRRSGLLASLCAAALLFTAATVAQTTSSPSLANDTGIHSQETYDGVRENVNLAGGGLTLSIPLLSLPGRNGLDFSVSMTYNSQFWVPQYGAPVMYWTQDGSSWLVTNPGPSGLNPTTTVNPNPSDPNNVMCEAGYVLVMGDGSKFSVPELRTGCKWWDTVSEPLQPHWVYDTQYDVLTSGVSGDLQASVDLTYGTVTMKDGSVATLSGVNGGGFSSFTDTKGNQISLGTYVDTVGRAITFGSGSVQYKDSSGSLQTVTINNQSLPVSCTFPLPATSGGMPVSQPQGTLGFPTSVVLPNGLTYTFQYDGCGGLVKITYPSGGYTRYAYDYQSYAHRIENVGPYVAPYTYPEVVAKYVCRAPAIAFGATSAAAGANCPVPEDVTTYSPTINNNNTMFNNAANSVTDPLGNVTSYEFSQGDPSLSAPPLETSRAIYQGGSTLLRTIQTTYLSPFGYPTSKTTTLQNGLATQTQWDYDSNNNVTEVREYAYGLGAPGALVRKTQNTWGIFNRKTSEKVFDGSNNKLSETDYELDNYTAGISASGAVQHSSAFGPSYTNRGNVTAITRWRNTDGAMLSTRNQYDDAGNVLSTTAPSNSGYDNLTRTTTYSYTDSCGNTSCLPTGGSAKAYVTQVTDPAGLITKSSYNSCTGTKATSTDQNNQVTTFAYDLLNRRTLTTAPPADGGQISTCYSDVSGSQCYRASYPRTAVTTQKITASVNKLSTSVMDGLSRLTQTQLNSDPDGVTYVDMTYDGAERQSTVSNAYRNTSDPTYGITTTQYDALGRVTMLIPPDGTSGSNNVTTNYDLISTTNSPPTNCSIVTDEALKFRQSCSDALGRLVEVGEPTSTANGTPGTGTVFISGSEQNPGATHSSATISISGFEQPPFNYCPPQGGGSCQMIYDSGNYQLWIGTQSYVVSYGQTSTASSLASLVASAANSSQLVTATANGGSVTLTSIGTGPTVDYTLSSSFAWDSQFFSNPSFTFSTPSGMTGGSANPPDTGTVSVTVGGFTAQATYGVSSTSASVASDLANIFNTNGLSPVTASLSGSSLSLTATTTGPNTNYPVSFAAASSDSYPRPSFTASAYTSSLTGGESSGGSLVPYVTLYNYDVLDNLLCVEQHGGVSGTGCSAAPSSDASSAWRVRRFSYNSLGQLLTSSNPEISMPVPPGTFCTVGYSYDNVGNLYQKTGPKPNQSSYSTTVATTYGYDADNRLKQKSYNDGSTAAVQYGYDGAALTGCKKAPPTLPDSYGIGRRTSMCDGSGSTAWDHDPMGRVLQDRRFIGGIAAAKYVNYSYNLDGSLLHLTTPPQKSLAYQVGGAGRALSVKDTGDNINFATGATYAPPGELQTLTNGGVIHEALAYNSRLQPVQMFYGTNTPPPVTQMTSTCPGAVGNVMNKTYNFGFGSGNNGNVLPITNCLNTTRNQSFTYDALNRIASGQSSGPQWGETFSVDPWGNLTNEAGISGKTSHEGLNAPANTNNQLVGFGYDAAGNMTSNGATSYVYDAENRLIWTSGESYVYDGDGKRVEKCAAATVGTPCPTSGTNGTLYWRGVGTDTIDETDLSGNPVEEYIFFNGARIARRDVTSTGATIAVHYYFSDQVGSHSVIENATGTATEQDIDYYPYGAVQNDYCTACVAQHYKFNATERDAESGLDNFGARYDTSSLGRFMTPDWAEKPTDVPYAHFGNPQSLNLYSYVENNPTTFGDPDGHVSFGYDGSGGCTAGEEECQSPSAQSNNAKAANTQAQNQSKKQGFWSRLGQHLGNLFGGHSWNFGMRESVTTRIVTEVREPNPYVAIGTDALGVVGEATHHASLGRLGAAISIVNDPSATNVAMTGAAFIPVVGEGVGAVAAVQDVATPVAQGFVDHVMTPMFNAAPPQNIEDGNGHLIPNPALMDECQAMGGCY